MQQKTCNAIFSVQLIVFMLFLPSVATSQQLTFQQASFSLPSPMSDLGRMTAYVPSNDAIYVFGGVEDPVGGPNAFTNSILKFDLNQEQVLELSTPLPFTSQLHALAVDYRPKDQQVYIFHVRDVYRFDPETEEAATLIGSDLLPESVGGMSIVKYIPTQDAFYIFGNRGSGGGNFTYRFDPDMDPVTDSVQRIENTMRPSNNTSPSAAYCPTRDVLYMFGGNFSSQSFDLIQRFDPSSNTFFTLPITLPVLTGGTTVEAVPEEDAVYIFGGYDNSRPLANAYKFDCTTETLEQLPDPWRNIRISVFRHSLGVEYVPTERRIYVFGGSNSRGGGFGNATDAISYLQLLNTPPVAQCQNRQVPAGPSCTADASIDNGSFDSDGDPITLIQDPPGPYPLGSTEVTLTVTDDKGASSQCIATVTVVDDTPPVPAVTQLSDATRECSVTLTPPSATDNCAGTVVATTSDPLTYTTQGTFIVTWTYDDGNGNTSQQTQNVVVDDVTAPVVTAELVPIVEDDDDDEEGRYAVQCSATDNCDTSPGVSSVMQIPSMNSPVITFKVKSKKKLEFNHKKKEVKVEGPDPQGLWAAVQNAGGVAVSNGQVLKLRITGEKKDTYKFDKSGNLTEVKGKQSRTLVCTTTDAAGNVGTMSVSPGVPPDDDDNEEEDEHHSKKDDGDDDSMAEKLTATTLDAGSLPNEFALAQNHPNPFNPSTMITFAVPEAGEITLSIYNLVGQLVQTLHSGAIGAGRHSRVWNGKDFRGAKVSSGVYIYQLRAKGFVVSRQLVLKK